MPLLTPHQTPPSMLPTTRVMGQEDAIAPADVGLDDDAGASDGGVEQGWNIVEPETLAEVEGLVAVAPAGGVRRA